MATTIALERATPYSLTYTMTGDGVAGARTGADLIADCVPGPLRALLVKFNAASKLDHLNVDAAGPGLESRGLVRIRFVDGNTDVQTLPAIQTISWAAGQLNFTATAQSLCQIEIRFQHSRER